MATGAVVPERLLLRDSQAAPMVGLHRGTLRRLVAQGLVPPPLHVGCSTFWRRDELLAWIDAGCPPMRRWVWPLPRGVRGGKR